MKELKRLSFRIIERPYQENDRNEIKLREYRSFPEKPYEVVKKVIERLGSMKM